MRVGVEQYALPVDHVLEVAELGDLAAVPGAPSAVLGVRNLRGQVLPVFDLAAVLGLPRDGAPARLVVVEQGSLLAGLAIDEVHDVEELPDELQETSSDLLAGAVLTRDALVGVLDLERLFTALAPPARRSA